MLFARIIGVSNRFSWLVSKLQGQNIQYRLLSLQSESPLSDCTWLSSSQLSRIVNAVGTPVFIYNQQRLHDNVASIIAAAESEGYDRSRLRLFLPLFANSNPHLIRTVVPKFAGLLLQVREEIEILRMMSKNAQEDPLNEDSFAVSSTYLSNKDIDFFVNRTKFLYLSSLDELKYLCVNYPAQPFRIRINLSAYEKPGFRVGQLAEVTSFMTDNNLSNRFRGYHCYFASENSIESVRNAVEEVFIIWHQFFSRKPLAAYDINLGGGYGFDYHVREPYEAKHFPWRSYFIMLREVIRRFGVDDRVSFFIEPGRDILADVGVFVMQVTRDLINRPGVSHLPTDGSFIYMPSAKVRQRQHNVLFVNGVHLCTKHASPTATALLRGRTTLRNDNVLPGLYSIPDDIRTSDYIVVLDTGAYCATQHLEHGNLTPAPEVLVNYDGSLSLISARGSLIDKARNIPIKAIPL